MRVGCVQLNVQRGEPAVNVASVRSLLAGRRFDLVVLPELFDVGYLHGSRLGLQRLATVLPDGELIGELAAIADEVGGTVVAGIAERSGELLFNTAVAVTSKGLVARARKNHPTRLERPLFEAGEDAAVFDMEAARVGIATCFDLWLPEFPRLLVREGARVLACPANFGGPDTLDVARVRALENRSFVLLCNRVGSEDSGALRVTFRGESRVIDPSGQVLVALDGAEGICEVTIESQVAQLRSSPMCDDLDREMLRYSLGRGVQSEFE